jgi:hypothetical protein
MSDVFVISVNNFYNESLSVLLPNKQQTLPILKVVI